MNAKVAKMMEFIKTYGEYTCRFNFGIFFQIHNPPLLLEKNRSSENAVHREWVISFCLGDNDKKLEESFA